MHILLYIRKNQKVCNHLSEKSGTLSAGFNPLHF